MDEGKITALESGVNELLELALAEKNLKLRTIYNDVASIFASAASELRSAREEIGRLTQEADSWSNDAKTLKAECEHLRTQLSAPEASAVTVDEAIRAGCKASDVHLTCSYPECNCGPIPRAIKAALAFSTTGGGA